jgi:hypothetical protein
MGSVYTELSEIRKPESPEFTSRSNAKRPKEQDQGDGNDDGNQH